MQTNRNSTRRSLLVSATALILSIAMLVGTTFAWFTDTASTGVNRIQAGNLDVELDYYDGRSWVPVDSNTKLFHDNALWEPGHTEVAYLHIKNAGSLDFKYKLNVNIPSETGSINQKGQAFKLSDYLVFGKVDMTAANPTFADRAAARDAVAGTAMGLSSWTKAGNLYAENNQGVHEKYVALVIYMPETVGNEANHKTGVAAPTIELGVNIVAAQLASESDSFGNDYDANADGNPDNGAAWTMAAFRAVADVPSDVNTAGMTITKYENDAEGAGNVIAKVDIPNNASLTAADKVALSIVPTNLPDTVAVRPDQAAFSYDITLKKVANDNIESDIATTDVPVTVTLKVGTGLVGVRIFHTSGGATTEVSNVTYDPLTGYASFTATSFSDYTVVYNAKYTSGLPENTKFVTNQTQLNAALNTVAEGGTIILDVGEYEPFCVKTANVTIKGTVGETKEASTWIKSTDTFTSSADLTSGNLQIRAAGVTIDSIWFDVTNKQTTGDWRHRGAFFAGAENATIKNCMIEGSGKDSGSTAAFFYGKKITITGCTFKNFERGFYHMGDNISDPQFTITNNTFEDVLAPFDTYISQPLSSKDVSSYITITGNTVTGNEPSYIQVWDHAQWTKKSETLTNYAGIKNVTLNNTGNIVYYLTHFNMLTENTGVSVTKNENQEVKIRSYVEVDSSYKDQMTPYYNAAGTTITSYGSISHSDGSEITDWNEHPFIKPDGDKYFIYTIVPGDYKLLKESNGQGITDFEVSEQQAGTIQKISMKPVSVGLWDVSNSTITEVGSFNSIAEAISKLNEYTLSSNQPGLIKLNQPVTEDVNTLSCYQVIIATNEKTYTGKISHPSNAQAMLISGDDSKLETNGNDTTATSFNGKIAFTSNLSDAFITPSWWSDVNWN